MIKIDESYTDYFDDTDDAYPGGKAVDAPSDESIEGTPLKANFFNDVIGFFQALIVRANGDFSVSGRPDKVGASDLLNAILSLVGEESDARNDAIIEEADARMAADSEHAALTSPHSATSSAIAGRIIVRDKNGRAKVAAPVEEDDIARKADVDAALRVVMPIGTKYVLLPGEKSPEELWPFCNWENVSGNWAGDFFRVEGGNALPFGDEEQEDTIRNITGKTGGSSLMATSNATGGIGAIYLVDGGSSPSAGSGSMSYHNVGFDASLAVPTSNENRPINRTIQIWQITSYK